MKKLNNSNQAQISSTGSKSLMIHRSNPDFEINKSDLQIYLGHYKASIENRRKDSILITLVKVAFVWSIFFTADFISIGDFKGSYIRILYIILATSMSYNQIQKSIKRDNSKYKEIDPEKMADIIEENCKKAK
jgi:hypothetical protein